MKIGTIVLLMMLLICTSCGNNEDVSEDVIGNEGKVEEVEEVKNGPQEPSSLTMTPAILLDILRESFIDFTVEYVGDDNVFIFEPTSEEVREVIEGLSKGKSGEYLVAWNLLKDGIVGQSEFISAMEEHEYAFAILNPENVDNYLLLIVDDEVRYDFTGE